MIIVCEQKLTVDRPNRVFSRSTSILASSADLLIPFGVLRSDADKSGTAFSEACHRLLAPDTKVVLGAIPSQRLLLSQPARSIILVIRDKHYEFLVEVSRISPSRSTV